LSLIDAILNCVCLLLWLNWRSVRLADAARPSVLSLAATVKRAEPRPPGRWVSLGVLLALLSLRSFFYRQVGSSVHWTPEIHLVAIALHFRVDFLDRMLLFSLLGFIRTLGIFYLCLILLSIANRNVPDEDPNQRIVRQQLGRVSRWPASVQLLLIPGMTGALWLLFHGVFASLGLITKAASWIEAGQQAVVLGAATFVAWKFFVIALLAVYFLNSYIYLGKSSLWHFLDLTGRNLLRPLRWLPLGIGKADLAPLVAIGLVLLLAHFGAGWLTHLYLHPPL
jgi:uncharacterized protein YggT (Ycf19 family)